MEYCYKFAGIRLRVCGSEEVLYSDHGVLAPFLAESKGEGHRLSFEFTDHIPSPEGDRIYEDGSVQVYRNQDTILRCAGSPGSTHMRIERAGNSSYITCLRKVYPNGITPKTVLNSAEAEHFIVQGGGFVLHASLISIGQKAVLFTAPSGTGKSTQADLWCRYRDAELINGDRAAITVENGEIFAHGIPYSGSSGVGKRAKLPIAAIVYLGQAPSNRLEELKGFAAFRKIWEGCSVNVWDKDDVGKASEAVLATVSAVPVFYLNCRPDLEAVQLLEKELIERRRL